jgi:hypothetical protein
MISLLDSKGKLGWELVSVIGSLQGGTSLDEYWAFLKKPVNGEI